MILGLQLEGNQNKEEKYKITCFLGKNVQCAFVSFH